MRLLPCAIFLICLIGCGLSNPQGRLPIQGTVSLNDQPIITGAIHFESVPGASLQISTGAIIQDGKYSIQQELGLAPGEYLVRISAPVGTAEIAKGTNTPLVRDVVPPKYNVASQEKVSVSKDKKSYDFNLVVTEADFQDKLPW